MAFFPITLWYRKDTLKMEKVVYVWWSVVRVVLMGVRMVMVVVEVQLMAEVEFTPLQTWGSPSLPLFPRAK